MTIVIYSIALILICTGLIGAIVPIVPGVPIMFLGVVLIAFYTHFSAISLITVIIIGILVLASLAIDFLSGIIGAKKGGATQAGLGGGCIGSIFGLLILGPFGLILGPALGIFIFDLIARRSIKKSTKVATYSLLSSLVGIILNGIIALTILIIFIISIL